MRDLTGRALNTAARRGATYADIRVVRRLDESISIKSGRVEGVASGESEGFGVRVLVDGAWGFASSNRLEPAEVDRVAAEAVRIARASATALRRPVVLDDRPPAHGSYETPVAEDPFAVPLKTKIGDLLAADAAANAVKGIAFTESMYGAQREWKTFAASDGSFTEQTTTHVGSAVEANATEGDELQRRAYPDNGGGWQAAGYEWVRSLDLQGHSGPYAEEAVALLSAPQCPPGRTTIVPHPRQLPVQGMSLDDIVADTDDGLYLAQCRSWSIDDRRLNFQFATEVAYEIKGGKRGRLLKNPTYTGITYEFWRSCDAVGDASSFRMLGTPNCGKGEPGQV